MFTLQSIKYEIVLCVKRTNLYTLIKNTLLLKYANDQSRVVTNFQLVKNKYLQVSIQ